MSRVLSQGEVFRMARNYIAHSTAVQLESAKSSTEGIEGKTGIAYLHKVLSLLI